MLYPISPLPALRLGVYPSLSPGVLTRLFCRGVHASLFLCRGLHAPRIKLHSPRLTPYTPHSLSHTLILSHSLSLQSPIIIILSYLSHTNQLTGIRHQVSSIKHRLSAIASATAGASRYAPLLTHHTSLLTPHSLSHTLYFQPQRPIILHLPYLSHTNIMLI